MVIDNCLSAPSAPSAPSGTAHAWLCPAHPLPPPLPRLPPSARTRPPATERIKPCIPLHGTPAPHRPLQSTAGAAPGGTRPCDTSRAAAPCPGGALQHTAAAHCPGGVPLRTAVKRAAMCLVRPGLRGTGGALFFFFFFFFGIFGFFSKFKFQSSKKESTTNPTTTPSLMSFVLRTGQCRVQQCVNRQPHQTHGAHTTRPPGGIDLVGPAPAVFVGAPGLRT